MRHLLAVLVIIVFAVVTYGDEITVKNENTPSAAPVKEKKKEKGKMVEGRWRVLKEVVEDTKTGFIWQRGDGGQMEWDFAKQYCDSLDLGGYNDWRLPTINELRTIIKGCSGTKDNGSCAVRDNCLSDSCWSKSSCWACPESGGPGENGLYWQKGVWSYNGDKYGWFWSSSELSGYAIYPWLVEFGLGYIGTEVKISRNSVRCIRFNH